MKLLCAFAIKTSGKLEENVFIKGFDPCCSMPCNHRGICIGTTPSFYECICPAGYYGSNCEKSTFSKWLVDILSINQAKKLKCAISGRLFWSIVNNVPVLHDVLLRYLYSSNTNLDSFNNQILYNKYRSDSFNTLYNGTESARNLPPVPLKCPTPLGIKGPQTLPHVNFLFNYLFQRTKFKSCPLGTNLMFSTFAQYLAYQFFNITHPKDVFDLNSNFDHFLPYGSALNNGNALRSWINGKLKTRVINGEEYPPYLEDVPEAVMYYPELEGKKSVFPKWAMTHKMMGITPFMFVIATIWLREHNRVCDIIGTEHPDWNDEKLYKTAKMIVLGQLLTITVGEFFQHLGQYRLKLGYKPHLIHQRPYSYQMNHEFSLLFQWHFMMPDVLSIQGKQYNFTNLIFSNNRIVFEHGLDAFVDFMSRNPAGQIAFRNCGKAFENYLKFTIEEGRRIRLQSFNNYRRFFNLKPYKSFREMTGNEEVAQILKKFYGDVEAVELIVGIFVEKHFKSVLPPTMILLTESFAFRRILNNPIGSSALWHSSTFGGKTGFDIVQKASLKKLVCLNLKGNCKNNVWVSFKTPTIKNIYQTY